MSEYQLTADQEQRAQALAATTSLSIEQARFLTAYDDGNITSDYVAVGEDGKPLPPDEQPPFQPLPPIPTEDAS